MRSSSSRTSSWMSCRRLGYIDRCHRYRAWVVSRVLLDNAPEGSCRWYTHCDGCLLCSCDNSPINSGLMCIVAGRVAVRDTRVEDAHPTLATWSSGIRLIQHSSIFQSARLVPDFSFLEHERQGLIQIYSTVAARHVRCMKPRGRAHACGIVDEAA